MINRQFSKLRIFLLRTFNFLDQFITSIIKGMVLAWPQIAKVSTLLLDLSVSGVEVENPGTRPVVLGPTIVQVHIQNVVEIWSLYRLRI